MKEISLDAVIVKMADRINHKRRSEIINIYNSTDLFREIKRIKDLGLYDKGNKSKSMKKIASIPYEVDLFFSKIYGSNYYKEPDFFTKTAPEWRVVDHV